MRVLKVIHYPVFGGPHNTAVVLHRHLAERGIELSVVLPDEPGNALLRMRDAGLDVHVMDLHRLRATPSLRTQREFGLGFRGEIGRLAGLAHKLGTDVMLLGGLVNPHAAIAARRLGIAVVWQILDTRPPMALRAALMPIVLRLSDTVMSTGYEVARVHPGATALGDRLFTYLPPVDIDRFRPDAEARAAARAELQLTDAPVVGMVANLNPMKDQLTFVRAAAELRRAVPDAQFVLLGATYPNHREYEQAIRAEAASLGLEHSLVIRDPGARVAELASALDIFWLTSEPRSEGAPTVVGEAMALGLPVVASDVGSLRETTVPGVTSRLVPPRTPAAFAAATAELLGDETLRAAIGSAARAYAVENYAAERCADVHASAFETALRARPVAGHRPTPIEREPPAADPPDLVELLVCPRCRGDLSHEAESLECAACDESYPVVDGIPVMLPSGDSDEVKLRQAAFFDEAAEADPEYEIERPHGTPELHRWMLEEKYRRSVAAIASELHGALCVTVCGGSGMDAEFLARSGARVIASDLSVGAVRRAQERARRRGLPIAGLVADVERLPLRDGAVDVAYVHDGLHHIERPELGVAEMARVARRAVSNTEPAAAGATRVAVRAGLAEEQEEAGNRVERLLPEQIAGWLEARGFQVVESARYGMFYRHEAGWAARALSRPIVAPAAKALLLGANAVGGSVGNKLTVQAVGVPELHRYDRSPDVTQS